MQVKENPSWNRLYIIFGIGWLKNYHYGLESPKKNLINFLLFYIDHLSNSSQLAPNLITLIGLAFNGASFLMLLFYRSNNGSASSSIYFFNAISLFVYQVKILIFRRLIFFRKFSQAHPTISNLVKNGNDFLLSIKPVT